MILLLFSHSVVSDSLHFHGLQHTRLPCPLPTPRACSNMSIESVMPSNYLILCHPLLPPSIFPHIRVFSSKSALHIVWPKHWSFSFSISPSNEHWGLISFKVDWLDLLAVQGTLKRLLQHHSSKASILQCSAFFMVQLSQHTWLCEEQCPHKRLSQTCLWVSWSLWWRYGSTVLPQAKQQGRNTAHQQKIGLKVYWAWPRPSEQDPVSPQVSLSHQEASISLLSLFIRRQTEWKPKSQKTNQTDHMDHSLV